MKGLDKLLKSEAFASVMTQFQTVQNMTFDDYNGLIDSYITIKRSLNDDDMEDAKKIISNMTLSYNLHKITFKEFMLLLQRFSSHFYVIS